MPVLSIRFRVGVGEGVIHISFAVSYMISSLAGKNLLFIYEGPGNLADLYVLCFENA